MNNELKHYGHKGMHWGERHWQYPDGRFTPEGKERYFGTKHHRPTNPPPSVKEKFGQERTIDGLGRKTIPPGYTFYRIQRKGTQGLGNANGGVYVYSGVDKNNLRSILPWFAQTQGAKISDFEEIELKTTKPIKVASQEDVNRVMTSMQHDPSARSKVMKTWVYGTWMSDEDISKYESMTRAEKVESLYNKYIKESKSLAFKLLKKPNESDKKKAQELAEFAVKEKEVSKERTEKILKVLGKTNIEDPLIKTWTKQVENYVTSWIASDISVQKYFYDKLKEQGFDAMYDNNMIGAGLPRLTQEAHEPLIFLDNESVKQTGNTTPMTMTAWGQAEKAFRQYVNDVNEDAQSKLPDNIKELLAKLNGK